ncbi:molybdate-anion transporter isoform X3 [Calonectris borealis]|uniref:molybdate-anion transporter isoform X3 n=1 Tax=Calonectris borealis TaxID=1323832 RepID=UPI003F4BFAF2
MRGGGGAGARGRHPPPPLRGRTSAAPPEPGDADDLPSAMLLASYSACALLLAACLALELAACRSRPPAAPHHANPAFRRFQRGYYRVYLPALAADWLQGPYLYKLYQHYRFLEGQIAILYVCGFASSVLFGLVSSSLVDRLGRKKSCVLFSLTYSICCLAKLSQDYLVLVAGRVLGGLSTALLFSAFEAWYVHEHVERYDFPTEWIAVTFSRAAFWNNVIAVGAGGAADFFAEWLGLGPVAPFMVSIPFLVLSGVFAVKNWDENYGKKRAFSKTCGDGLKCLLSDRRVLLLGTIQALFESVIYIFIFLWTPVLDPHGAPLGVVFSGFMAASMLGSSLYRLAVSKSPGQESPVESFLAFLLIELSCGLYFPAMGFLRRKVVPEKDRLGVMNWFRLPLNLLACLGLLVLHDSDRRTGTRSMFGACAAVALLALLAAGRLFALSRRHAELRLPATPGQADAADAVPEP